MAIDGRGGSGKSTFSAEIERLAAAVVIDSDDFYSGPPVGGGWASLSPAERSERCVDWKRQRSVLEALRSGAAAHWQPYDWERDDGSREPGCRTCQPAHLIILEGTFSARPELADLLDLRVLLDTEPAERRRRFTEREGAEEWLAWARIWNAAEDYYFTHTMPPRAFDLIART